MNLLLAHQTLKSLAPIFFTQEAAHLLQISRNHAATLLARLAKQKIIVHIARNRWAYTDSVDPLLLPNLLAHPMMAYISLYSALYYHGMISQIPSTVFAISNGKTKQFNTPLARVSIHHINPALFTGYTVHGKQGLLMASSEKALFDTLYLLPAKSNIFKKLTEIELPEPFHLDYMSTWLKQVNHKGRRVLIEKALEELTF